MKKILIGLLAISLILTGCVSKNAGMKEDTKVSIENKEDVKEETPKEEDKMGKPKEEVKEEKKEQSKDAPKVENKTTDKKIAAAPKTTTNNTTVTETKPSAKETPPPVEPPKEQPKYDNGFQKKLNNATPNNGKFKITFDKTSGPAPQGIIYYIDAFKYDIHKKSEVKGFVVFNENSWSSGDNFYGFMQSEPGVYLDKFKGFLSVPGYKDMPNKADLYVLITSVEDGKTYYEKVTYSITSVDVK